MLIAKKNSEFICWGNITDHRLENNKIKVLAGKFRTV